MHTTTADLTCLGKNDMDRLTEITTESSGHPPAMPINQKHRRDRDAEYADLYEAFTKPAKPERAHELPDGMYGGTPNMLTGHMMWKAPEGISGIVPYRKQKGGLSPDLNQVYTKVGNELRHPIQELYGRSVVDMIATGHAIRVNNFRIAYTIMWPDNVDINSAAMDRLPLIGLLHGVPMNRRMKYKTMRRLAKFAICVCWDMLGMGESDMPLEYGNAEEIKDLNQAATATEGGKIDYDAFHRQWRWEYDAPYIHQLMTQHIPAELQTPSRKWIFQADDWGAGCALAYASSARYSFALRMLILLDPIILDGYHVIEIGTIGKLAELFVRNAKGFAALVPILPQTIAAIEKYMVFHRKRMNRYTETDYLFPYQDSNYLRGKTAAGMHHNEWGILCLANRSSRLAPRQLLPYHATKNPWGLRTWNFEGVFVVLWGTEDQMMPPTQLDRLLYLFPNASFVAVYEVDGADHFLEIDRPDAVSRIMIRAINGMLGRGTTRAMVGLGTEATYKGDEPEIAAALDAFYGAP